MKRASLFVLAALVLCGSLVFGVAPFRGGKAADPKIIKDLSYYDGKDRHKIKHSLDLYLPPSGDKFPVVLFIHGGAWLRGGKDGHLGVYTMLGRVLAREGIGVAVANYRLSPEVKHPEHARDVARAVAWVHGNIAKHGGDPQNLFLSGHSAGGHLVSLVTTDEAYLKEHNLTSKAIRGVVPISGVYYIPDRIFPQVFGPDGENRKKASPATHVRRQLPPFLILYADNDLPGCDKDPSEKFCRALQELDVNARTLEIASSDHYRIILSAAMADTRVSNAIRDFVRDHAKN